MKKNTKYYDLSNILKLKDLEGKKPSIYLIESNRSAGKTTALLKYSLENFKKNNKQVCIIYRYKYELSSANEIYKDVMLLYPEYGKDMAMQSKAQGLFYELILDGNIFGYVVALSNIDALKKYSPLFSSVAICIFDEFQKEDNNYLSNEVNKLQSILVTIGRGGGAQARDLEIFLLGNRVSIMNPYYIQFGIHKRLKSDTHFMRGIGWVAEFDYNENAKNEMQKTGIYRAFQNTAYTEYMTEKRYLNDSYTFIEQPNGKNKYFATILQNGKMYGVLDFYEKNILYVTTKYDRSCKNVLTVDVNEHNKNTLMLTRNSYTVSLLKDSFACGLLYFKDLECKNVIFDILALDKMRH